MCVVLGVTCTVVVFAAKADVELKSTKVAMMFFIESPITFLLDSFQNRREPTADVSNWQWTKVDFFDATSE